MVLITMTRASGRACFELETVVVMQLVGGGATSHDQGKTLTPAS
jgi:hypothetical protein